MSNSIVAIVGRPNVGKSTLFNRLIGERQAITAEEPGTTRDRILAPIEWLDRVFAIVDTAGLSSEAVDSLDLAVRNQVQLAIEEADTIIFMADVATGVTPAETDIADLLRRSDKPIILAVNKCDNKQRELGVTDFYTLGLGEPLILSAYHNIGVGDLLDRVVETLPVQEESEEVEGMRLAIVGRPNSGKSMMLNAFLGEQRAVVSEVPGTTRDSIDTVVTFRDETIHLIDTAGIRRRGRIEVGIEKFSTLRSIRAIERADIALLLLDASELASAQDTHIAGYVLEAYKGLIIVVNKWDLAKGLELDEQECERLVRYRFRFAPYAPILYASGLEGVGLPTMLDAALGVYEERNKRVTTGALNRVVDRAAGEHLPRAVGRRRLHLLYTAQVDVNPPTFVFFVNDPKLLHFAYRRFLENRIREKFDFTGTPLRFIFKARGEE